MKETVNVSIASQAFILDEDAWRLLDGYLKSIRSRLDADDSETLADIESRIADLFRESLPSPMMVVTSSLVRRVMELMGSPEIFGAPRYAASDEGDGPRSSDGGVWQRPLRRSSTDKVLGGVCGGIARNFECDSSAIRLLTLLLIVFGGLSVWIYIILWIVIPSENQKEK